MYRAKKTQHIENFLSLIEDDASFDLITTMKKRDVIDSDRWAFVVNKTEKGDRITLLIADRTIYEDWSGMLKHLRKYYTYDVILALIYERCVSKERIISSRLRRYVEAIRFFSSAKNKKLVKSNLYIVKHIFEQVFGDNDVVNLTNEEVEIVVSKISDLYIEHENSNAKSFTFRERLKRKAEQLWALITVYEGDHDWSILKLPKFNTQFARSQRSIQQIFALMFSDDIFESNTKILIEQNAVSRQISEKVLEDLNDEISTDVVSDTVTSEFDASQLEQYNEEIDSKYIQQQLLKESYLIEKTEENEEKEEIDNINLSGIDLGDILDNL